MRWEIMIHERYWKSENEGRILIIEKNIFPPPHRNKCRKPSSVWLSQISCFNLMFGTACDENRSCLFPRFAEGYTSFDHDKEVTNLSISPVWKKKKKKPLTLEDVEVGWDKPLLILKNVQVKVAANNTIIQSHGFQCDRFINAFLF